MRHSARAVVFAIGLAGAWVTFAVAAATESRPVKWAHESQAASAAHRKVAALEAAIADIEAGRRTTPLIGEPTPGGTRVTFLARRGGGRIPRIVSDVTGWGERPDDTFDFAAGTMRRVGQTDWYFLEAKLAPRARIEYLVAHGLRDYRPDQYNPRQTRHRGSAPASEFVMPDYVPPQEFEDPPTSAAGRVTETSVESRALGEPRTAIVYTPPGYRHDGDYPVAVFHGGLNAVHTGEAPRVLDWLIAHQAIEPIVAVFVDSWPRDTDDRAIALLRTFLGDELPAWVASRYSVTKSAGKRAVLGISFGAKDALDAAVMSDWFGRLGLLIPGRRLRPADLGVFAARPGRRLRVSILAGLYDGPNLPTARSTRQALATAGHTVDYIEVPEGHNQETWRTHLSNVLVSLFGTKAETR